MSRGETVAWSLFEDEHGAIPAESDRWQLKVPWQLRCYTDPPLFSNSRSSYLRVLV